ncbi:metal-dependent hydrolase [Alkalihalobacterium sp. APHAB7]|uniref:metal-dependent hydrolase n=1 Tax=Alkalihalobacterium sp. APHAB7 TaxID=3402081 RepID=UPI003AAC21E9
MKGSTHLVVGVALGGAFAYIGKYDLVETIGIVTTCAIASIIPDMDTNSKITRKLTIPVTLVYAFLGIVGLMITGYGYWLLDGSEKIVGMVIGCSLIVLPQLIIKPKSMLILTGSCTLVVGILLSHFWIIGLAIYMIISAFAPHRGITHSIWGFAFFGWILSEFQAFVGMDMLMAAGLIGYASHLLCDMKWLPVNRKGIKLFQPFIKLEF